MGTLRREFRRGRLLVRCRLFSLPFPLCRAQTDRDALQLLTATLRPTPRQPLPMTTTTKSSTKTPLPSVLPARLPLTPLGGRPFALPLPPPQSLPQHSNQYSKTTPTSSPPAKPTPSPPASPPSARKPPRRNNSSVRKTSRLLLLLPLLHFRSGLGSIGTLRMRGRRMIIRICLMEEEQEEQQEEELGSGRRRWIG
jgi:hypothetical protein